MSLAVSTHSPGYASVWHLLQVEWTSAILSSALVSPFISIIDQSIVAHSSGRQPLWAGIGSGLRTLILQPIEFVRRPAFLLIWTVYAGTYVVANTVESVCHMKAVSPTYPKFMASSVANVGLSVWKDRILAQLFGSGKARPLPASSFGLFALRDSLTILASFSLPPIVSANLHTNGWTASKHQADLVAQLTVPCLMQLGSTPLHLLGLDLYNRAQAPDRVSFIRREYVKTTLARMGRIFPAYGVGGVVNKWLRTELKRRHPETHSH